jgi:type IV pilus assembly protein PilA
LVELMVVVLIIAILLAVAIPTFLSVRVRAQNIAARASVTDAYKAQRAAHVSVGSYTDDGAELEDIEPTINYATTVNPSCVAFDSPKCVQVILVSPLEVLLIGQASNGTYWAIRDIASGSGAGVFYNTGGSSVLPGVGDVTGGTW